MPKVDESIDVRVPVEQAYNQWTQFEEFRSSWKGFSPSSSSTTGT